MTDTVDTSTKPQTDFSASGLSTSEGKLAAVAMVLSVLGTVVPTLISVFTDLAAKFPTWAWTGPTIGVLSLVLSVLTALGYAKARASVKVALIENAVK